MRGQVFFLVTEIWQLLPVHHSVIKNNSMYSVENVKIDAESSIDHYQTCFFKMNEYETGEIRTPKTLTFSVYLSNLLLLVFLIYPIFFRLKTAVVLGRIRK